jgi:hypothetical protein
VNSESVFFVQKIPLGKGIDTSFAKVLQVEVNEARFGQLKFIGIRLYNVRRQVRCPLRVNGGKEFFDGEMSQLETIR